MDDPRPRSPWRAAAPIAAAMLLAAMLAGGQASPAAGVDPVGVRTDDPLLGPWVDVALVGQPATAPGSEPAPRALAVRAADPVLPGTVEIELLEAQGPGWRRVGSLSVPTGLSAPGPARLVALDGLYALVATDSGSSGRTSINLIDPAGPTLLGTGPMLETKAAVRAGPVDVDGDGTHELVLTSALRTTPLICPGIRLTVLDGRTLAVRSERDLDGAGLGGAAVGRFGRTKAQSIVGYDAPDCGTGDPDSRGVVVVDPASGALRSVGAGRLGPLGASSGPLVPFVADLDRDGVDEPIVRSDAGTFVLDPGHGWRVEPIQPATVPLAIVDPRDRPRLVLERTSPDGPLAIDLVAIGRIRPGAEVADRGLAGIELDPATAAGTDAAGGVATPVPVWVGDVDGSGCVAILVPGATLRRCPGADEEWTAEPGPAWLQTVPIAAYGEAGARHLLVAAGLGWAPPDGGLATPWPEAAAASQTGGWRSAPSRAFSLQVVDAGALSGTGRGGALNVGIADVPTPAALPEVAIASLPGDRLFVRVVPTEPDDPAAPSASPAGEPPSESPAGDPYGYLLTAPSGSVGEGAIVAPTVTESPGRALSVAAPLPPGAKAWLVDVLTLDGFGRPSAVTHARVLQDLLGPKVSVEPPLFSLPWPLSARLAGTAEPGARIRLGTGPFVPVGSDGRFAFETPLAPWPQDLEFEAVDAAGNPSWRTISAVGGFDYRQLPFQALVIVAVLLGAAATTFGLPAFVRRRSGTPVGATDPSPAEPWQPDRAPRDDRAAARRGPASDQGLEYGEIEDLPPRGRT